MGNMEQVGGMWVGWTRVIAHLLHDLNIACSSGGIVLPTPLRQGLLPYAAAPLQYTFDTTLASWLAVAGLTVEQDIKNSIITSSHVDYLAQTHSKLCCLPLTT